jgi:hypothetical protein
LGKTPGEDMIFKILKKKWDYNVMDVIGREKNCIQMKQKPKFLQIDYIFSQGME